MLRKTRGYDACSFFGNALSFDPSGQYQFLQGSMIPGPTAGNAWWIVNAFGDGGSRFVDKFDQQDTWVFGSHLQLRTQTSAPWTGTVEWLQICNDFGPLIYLRINSDLTISVVTGANNSAGAGMELRRMQFPLTQNIWYYIEFKVQCGHNGKFDMHINGSSVPATGLIPLMQDDLIDILPTMGNPLPDRITQHYQNSGSWGMAVDNMYILDGVTTDGLFDFLGQIAIQTTLPTADQLSAGWHPSTPGSLFPMVNDDQTNTLCPDGDNTFIAAITPAQEATWKLANSPCFGYIYALTGNICARPTSGSPFVGFIYQDATSTNLILPERQINDTGASLGQNNPGPVLGYATYQVVSTQNPVSLKTWTDGDINAGFFGVASDNFVTTERITQFYLEKLASLNTAIRFGCGGPGSYSYTH